jgi:ribonucleoside-diphosphate reductase alpha chain
MNRVASALQDNESHFYSFREILLAMRFMPGGRVQAAMGSLKSITPYNCFVMPTIHDSFTDGPEIPDGSLSIMDIAKAAASTMRQGGGVGYDISTLRPKGDYIHGVESTTDGPLMFAPIYDAICRATSSSGNRRGAQMLVMRCDHPDIEAFIHAKQSDKNIPYDYRPLRGFNMSIAITDHLMDCIKTDKPFPLKFAGKTYRMVNAKALWDMIMRATYDWAEPGVIFIDVINRMNNLYYCETIAATNPCGEQPLPPYGACLLGSFNLTKYIQKSRDGRRFNWEQLQADIPTVVRAMDNVIDKARYPLVEQQVEAQTKRRMGLGVTGLANCIEALGFSYGTSGFINQQHTIMKFINAGCYNSSVDLAIEKGSFPLYDKELYSRSCFIETLDEELQDRIHTNGIRNSHLTSIAPTGTISFCADNISSGIEPVFSYSQKRRIITPDGTITVKIKDYGISRFGVRGRCSSDVTPEEHINVLAMAQKHVDSSVSKTCNVPTTMQYSSFKGLYWSAYESGAKGCTTYRPNGNYDEVIKEDSCGFDPETGQRTGECNG